MFHVLWGFILQQIKVNQFLTAGLATVASGSILYAVRSVPTKIKAWFEYHFLLTLTITNDDPAFFWILKWLTENHLQYARTLKINTTYMADKNHSMREMPLNQDDHVSNYEKDEVKFNVFPGGGWYWFFYNKRIFTVTRTIEDKGTVEYRSLRNKETLVIQTIGRNRDVLNALVEECYKNAQFVEKTNIDVYLWKFHEWMSLKTLNKRNIETVILPEEKKDFILNDIKQFLGAEKLYRKMGIPYRRGYLFHGLPGTGKTSFAIALASHLNIPIYILDLSAIDEPDDIIQASIELPKKCICLVEDIDTVSVKFSNNENQSYSRDTVNRNKGPSLSPRSTGDAGSVFSVKNNVPFRVKSNKSKSGSIEQSSKVVKNGKETTNSKISISTILNTFDGVYATEGRILILTCNNRNVLNPTMLRKGRIDSEILFDAIQIPEIFKMMKRFYPEFNYDVKLLPKDVKIIPADLQNVILENLDNPEKVITWVIDNNKKL